MKMAVFMGCRSGEIEIGFSNAPRADMEMQMMSLFPDDFLRNLPLPDIQIPAAENVNPRPSSSSSSLRSPFSIDSHSPEYSSLLFNLPSTAATPAAASSSSQALLLSTPSAITPTTATTFPEQLMRTESEHAAMTSAFLAIMTSPSLSSTLNQPQQHPQPPPQQHLPQENLQSSAFARYTRARFKPGSSRRHSMLKRAIAYCRGMNLIRLHDRVQGVSSSSARPMSSTHIHHVMSERKRREKLNESYQSLKTLLPPGTKRYKAAVLAATREYLTLLRSQVEDLRRRNAILEAQLLPPPNKEAAAAVDESAATSSHEQSLSREEVSVRDRLGSGINFVARSDSRTASHSKARCPNAEPGGSHPRVPEASEERQRPVYQCQRPSHASRRHRESRHGAATRRGTPSVPISLL
ncbi:hypothetical protein MLD38_015371 [Melastoma candidum]|uniref:Uncharacterized protein n=1 Tax=Melastoma candidum TaxID=119954 RepID=A0ACB9RIZ5_9MYRT|nr:hypothetical protein MLD38_015371 [Melastoma candidum]